MVKTFALSRARLNMLAAHDACCRDQPRAVLGRRLRRFRVNPYWKNTTSHLRVADAPQSSIRSNLRLASAVVGDTWRSHMAVTRIGIRLAVSGLVLASTVITAVGVHLLWWRTAEANSHTLAATINEYIVSAVEKVLDSITKKARAATPRSVHRLFNMCWNPRSRQAGICFSFSIASPAEHFLGRIRPAGRCIFRRAQARRSRLGNDGDREVDGVVKRRVDEYEVIVGESSPEAPV